MWYCMSMTFGVFRLRSHQAIGLSAFVVASYGFALALLWRLDDIERSVAREVFAFSGLTLFLLCYCIVIDDVNRLRARANTARASRDRLTNADLGHQSASREVDHDLFRRALRNRRAAIDGDSCSVLRFEIVDAHAVRRECGADGLRKFEKYLANILLGSLPAGAQICSVGEGIALALVTVAGPADALTLARRICKEETDTVVLLPGVERPLVLRLAAHAESIATPRQVRAS
jgi:hypothetical protein